VSEQPKLVALLSDGDNPRQIGVFSVEQIAAMVEDAFITELEADNSGRFNPAFIQGARAIVRLRKGCAEIIAKHGGNLAVDMPVELNPLVEPERASEVCPEKPQPVNTYFIYSPKLEAVKIGRSVDPEKRLRAIKNGNPDELRLLGVLNDDREKEFHQRFAKYRTNGEWFSLGSRLLAFLKAEFDLINEQLP
jgi:Meiotically up-regulated gene 113